MTLNQLIGAVSLVLAAVLSGPAAADFAFEGCEGREGVITDAYTSAFSRAKAAEDRVADNELYETWFGEWTAERESIVRANLADIIAHSLIGTPAFTCYPAAHAECDEDGDGVDDAFAFVFEDESFEIHLCDPFWTVEQATNVDKTDVLIHEVSHFHIGAETDDHCYGDFGIGSCIDLAIAKPDFAVRNADSYMYFIKTAAGSF